MNLIESLKSITSLYIKRAYIYPLMFMFLEDKNSFIADKLFCYIYSIPFLSNAQENIILKLRASLAINRKSRIAEHVNLFNCGLMST